MKKNFTRKKFIISILLFIVIVLITIVAFVIFSFKNKLKQSQLINYSSFHSEELIATIDKQLIDLDETTLLEKESLILEKSIPELQGLVKDKKLTYEELTAIYLLRIKKLDKMILV